MRFVCVLLALVGCVADEPSDDGSEPLVAHKVTIMEIPVSPARANLSVGSPCFDVELAQFDGRYDCSVTEVRADGTQNILSMCGTNDDPACYRIERDELNCFDAAHERLEIERTTPITDDYVILVQCVSQ